MSQTTTFTIFRFSGWKNKFFALKSMAIFIPTCEDVYGLEFIKLMGSGGGDGFGMLPNLEQYTLICVWQNEENAKNFFDGSEIFKNYLHHVTSYQTIYLKTTMVHGLWGGKTPFVIDSGEHPEDNLVAVLTRATIRWKDMVRFWKDVPSVSRSLKNYSFHPLFAAGIGELPFRYQATFSIWENSRLMKEFAYKSKPHLDMVQKTRKTGWYSEELFARFIPYKTEGDDIIKELQFA